MTEEAASILVVDDEQSITDFVSYSLMNAPVRQSWQLRYCRSPPAVLSAWSATGALQLFSSMCMLPFCI